MGHCITVQWQMGLRSLTPRSEKTSKAAASSTLFKLDRQNVDVEEAESKDVYGGGSSDARSVGISKRSYQVTAPILSLSLSHVDSDTKKYCFFSSFYFFGVREKQCLFLACVTDGIQ